MKTENGKLARPDGIEIYWQAWLPDSPQGVCLVAHGLGEHSGRYAQVAEALSQLSLAAFALDHRGHGKSGGKRGRLMSFSEYIEDLHAFRGLVEQRFPNPPRFLLGHSLGGLIAAHYAIKHGPGLTGLILSSAALRVDVDAPALKLALGRFFSKVLPNLAMSNGLDPNFLSHDQKVVADYLADPLVHDRVSARWFTEFTAAIERAQEQAPTLSLPTLTMQSGDDKLVAPRGAQEFFDRLTMADKTLQYWPGFYHEMFNEVERDRPIDLTLQWIEKRRG